MNNTSKKAIGQRLQKLRLENNFTQEQLSQRLNLSTSAYCKIEYGETDLTLSRLNEIAKIYNMTSVELLCHLENHQNLHFNKDLQHINSPKNKEVVKVEYSEEIMELFRANLKILEILSNRGEVR